MLHNPETAGANLDTERCERHSQEYGYWQVCPKCRNEAERLLFAAHVSRRSREGGKVGYDSLPGTFDTLYDDPDDYTHEDASAALAFWRVFRISLICGGLLVLSAAWWLLRLNQ